MTISEKYKNYFNQIDVSKLKYIESYTPKLKYVKNTMNLYFKNINDSKIFTNSQLTELENWFLEISSLRKKYIYSNLPFNKHLKTEAVLYDNEIILKECLNLLHLISMYHQSYKFRIENVDEIKNTIFNISFDKRKMKQRYNKFESIANNLRLNRKDRAKYILIKRVLKLFLTKKYEKRARYYIISIALNFYSINWENLLKFHKIEEKVDKKALEVFSEIIHFFMYEKYSENKIKHSLMILVYTFFTKRMLFPQEDSLKLTNYLCNDILYDLDNRSDYTKDELSKDIYVHSIFNYLPIFSHYNEKNKPIYTKEEEKKIAQNLRSRAIILDEKLKSFNIEQFIDIFKNAHIGYINTELTYLYKTKNEKNPN